MLKVQPWAARAHGCADLAALRDATLGQAVRTVRYVMPRDESWPEGHRDDRAHEVDMAVELIMESRDALVLSWEMDGINEGLAVEFTAPEEAGVSLPGDAIDVSDHADWAKFLGVSITSISPAWHVPNDGCAEMPWAFRFEFANKSSLVIALGQAAGVGFAYLPDSLVVFFDKSLAVSYKIAASSTSSYGQAEWGYPEIGVVICDMPSGGHDAVMLDYAACGPEGEPAIAYIDEDRIPRRVAGSFEEFLARLISCDSVHQARRAFPERAKSRQQGKGDPVQADGLYRFDGPMKLVTISALGQVVFQVYSVASPFGHVVRTDYE